MLALPDTLFVARITRLATFFLALAVFAVGPAVFLAWWAGFVAKSSTLMTAKQGTVTLCLTWLMNSTTPTNTTVT